MHCHKITNHALPIQRFSPAPYSHHQPTELLHSLTTAKLDWSLWLLTCMCNLGYVLVGQTTRVGQIVFGIAAADWTGNVTICQSKKLATHQIDYEVF